MSEFYTNVQVYGSNILYRGIKDGKRVSLKVPFKPTIYSLHQDQSEFKSIEGHNLKQHTFASIREARDFVNEYKEVSNQRLYGCNNWQYQFIADKFRGTVPFDFSQIKKVSIDIETANELGGFPNPKEALEEVLLITIMDFETKKMYTLGSRPITKPNQHYIKCVDEIDLLNKFVRLIKHLDPDIITGWNVEKFDIAYLGTRISRLNGEDAWKNISPWNSVRANLVGDNKELVWDIEGIAVLDYLDLYKKFTYTTRESYKLDHIAYVELGKNKLESGYATFKEFYDNDFDKYVLYNQKDVELVDDLEVKLGLLYLACAVAYLGKVNYSDVYSPVKTWENFILSTLLEENRFAPLKKVTKSLNSIAGAYVKDVNPGFYRWVCSADAASLYPSIIIALNMSPETLQTRMLDVNVDTILNMDSNSVLNSEFAVAANGSMYSKTIEGILPRLMRHCMDGRKVYKKRMLEAKQKYNDTGDIQFKQEADKCGVMQLALKIFANSGYGAIANEYFLFFDNRIAEGITLTGQLLLKTVDRVLNAGLNSMCKTTGVDYAFYGDTDSVYFTMATIADKYYKDLKPVDAVKPLVKICEQKVIPIIESACDIVHNKLNAKEKTLTFKLEAIADSGFWVAKKKYALRYFYNEGVWYDTGELKVMGIEIVRSSTPSVVRVWLKEALPLIFDNKIQELRLFVAERRGLFNSLMGEEIAFPRSANNLKAYSDPDKIYQKGCPIAVRGSLLYNHYLKELGLKNRYEEILEGNKIKFIYLKTPNKFRENVIAFPGKIPAEMGISQLIDYDTQFEKTFLDPLNIIMDAIGWELEEKQTLSDFFS